MNKTKLKQIALKTGLDIVGIMGCAIVAGHIHNLVPALKGAELPMAVAAGIWLYVPLRNLIDKAASKIKK